MKKHIAFMISCIMLAVCFYYPAFAVTAPGRTITTSYDYGDVSVNVSVNGAPSETLVVGTSHYEHRFTVTLTNKTNTFQVASTNLFGLKLYTGNNYTFDSTGTDSSGNVYNLGSWGSEVTSYSDNMSVPTIKFYNSNSDTFKGCVYITFRDEDLLVLNPNETRSYDFTIDFTCYLPASAVPFNGNIQYSYFTYNGNVSIYNKPDAFTSNTVYDFIANDSFPNSVVAYILGSYEILSAHPGLEDYLNGYISEGNRGWATECSRNTSDYSEYVRMNTQNFRLISSNYDLFNSVNGTNYGNRDLIGAIDLYVHYRIISKGQYDTIINPINLDIDETVTFTLNGWTEVGSEYTIIDNKGINITQVQPDWNSTDYPNTHFISAVPSDSPTDSGNGRVATFDPNYFLVKITYYFAISDTTLNDVSNVPVINVTTPTTRYSNHRKADYTSHTLIWYLRNWWAEQHQDVNQDISDESGTVADTQDTIHAQEQQWYSDNEAAIEATGLSNFEFSSGELDGLTQLRLQFAQVWGALGDWTLVYIFVLSLSLATFILRHRPTTKAQQRMADSAKYRQDVRNRWAAQDARASNNSNGFSDEIWRRAGYL